MKHMAAAKKRNIRRTALLALLCVAGMELLFCRFADPALFARLTAPVTAAAQASSAAWDRLWDGRETPDSQAATAPAIAEAPPAADPVITELSTQDGRDVLTGGTVTVVFYDQGSDAWRDRPYGSDTLGRYGCGPTAVSMAVSSLTDTPVTPAEAAAWAVEHGHWARRSGSYLSLIPAAAAAYGLGCVSCPELTADGLLEKLAGGGVFVALMGPGHFTSTGHFILLRGVTLSGEVLVADPNSAENSLALWDPQLILDELSPSRGDGAPLWLLTLPAAAADLP